MLYCLDKHEELNDYAEKFVADVYDKFFSGKPFTTKQLQMIEQQYKNHESELVLEHADVTLASDIQKWSKLIGL